MGWEMASLGTRLRDKSSALVVSALERLAAPDGSGQLMIVDVTSTLKLLRLSLSQTRESFRKTSCLTCCCGGRAGVSRWVAR